MMSFLALLSFFVTAFFVGLLVGAIWMLKRMMQEVQGGVVTFGGKAWRTTRLETDEPK